MERNGKPAYKPKGRGYSQQKPAFKPVKYYQYGVAYEKHPEGWKILHDELRRLIESSIIHDAAKEATFTFQIADGTTHVIQFIPGDKSEHTEWGDEKNKADPLPLTPISSGIGDYNIIHRCDDGDYYVHYFKFPIPALTTKGHWES